MRSGDEFTCSGCGGTSAVHAQTSDARVALRRVYVPPHPLAVRYRVLKYTEWAVVCSPACWQKLLDDPSWERVTIPVPTRSPP